VKKYSRVEDLDRPLPQVVMPHAPRVQDPGGTNQLCLFYLATSPITPYLSDLEDVTIVRPAFLLPRSPEGRRVLDRNPGRGDPDGANYFRRSSNYGAGTINRVITIGTPYDGSPLSDAVLLILQDWIESLPSDRPGKPLGTTLMTVMGKGDRTAYADTSALEKQKAGSALWWLQNRTQPSGVPIHTIVGLASEKSKCPDWVTKVLTLALPTGESDLIVPAASQRAGLAYPATENMQRVCHTDETNFRFGENTVPLLDLLPKLLNSPFGASWFYGPGLPALGQ